MKLVTDIISRLSRARQAKIEARREALINEYLAATADEVITVKRDGTTVRTIRGRS